MDYKNLLAWATKKLQKKNIPSARLDAEVLLSFILKKPKEFILAHNDLKPNSNQIKKFKLLAAKRAAYRPVAQLTGHKEFFGLDFLINENVLAPRPETELLAELTADFIKNHRAALMTVVDVGTGSGCIIISLKKNIPQIKAIGLDISRRAIALAEKNAKKNKVKIKFIHSDLLERLPPIKGDYAIIANLPYLAKNGPLSGWEKKSISREPKLALYGGKLGWEQYEKLFRQIQDKHRQPLIIAMEINPLHWRQMQRLAKKYFPDRMASINKDLSGKRRILAIS